jgi:4-hydroxybenzoate polyprenyltransferase
MGMAFPLGMRQASTSAHELTPWLFGVNGATSVCSAVLAAAISLVSGFSVTYWAGVLAYVGAFAAFTYIARVTPGEKDLTEGAS